MTRREDKPLESPSEPHADAGARVLFRAMKMGPDRLPIVGNRWCEFGVRTAGAMIDIPVTADGYVDPNMEGMSVTPDDPLQLPPRHLPRRLGGRNPYELWSISEAALGQKLRYVTSARPAHGFVEPSYRMTLDEYRDALAETRRHWQLVESLPVRDV